MRALVSVLLAVPMLAVDGTASAQGTTVAGRVVTADGGSPGAVVAVIRGTGDDGRADSARVAADGRFAVPLPPGAGDSIDVALRGTATHHPARVRLAAAGAGDEMRILLVPRTWRIAAGRYAGRVVDVDPALALTPPCEGCGAFWKTGWTRDGAPWLQAWHPAAFPLGLAFDRAWSRPAGAAPDSAAFWRVVEAMEDAFGQDLFRPVRPGAVARADDDVVVAIDPALSSAGFTSVLGQRDRLGFASIRFRRVRPGDDALVTYELMHALGLGHTCAWRSIAADLRRCRALRSSVPTPEDVAYTQLLSRIRAAQLAFGARWGPD